jgi:hypothetical protein
MNTFEQAKQRFNEAPPEHQALYAGMAGAGAMNLVEAASILSRSLPQRETAQLMTQAMQRQIPATMVLGGLYQYTRSQDTRDGLIHTSLWEAGLLGSYALSKSGAEAAHAYVRGIPAFQSEVFQQFTRQVEESAAKSPVANAALSWIKDSVSPLSMAIFATPLLARPVLSFANAVATKFSMLTAPEKEPVEETDEQEFINDQKRSLLRSGAMISDDILLSVSRSSRPLSEEAVALSVERAL